MGVKRFAWALGALGVGLAVFGWLQRSPGAFVGVALVGLAGVLLATARRRPQR